MEQIKHSSIILIKLQSSPALEGSYELKEGKIIQKTSYGQEIILTQKIEGNTLVQINQTDTTRLTFIKQ